MDRPTVCAQLNVHPNDIGYVPVLLPHQVRAWAPQVERIHVTLDTHGAVAGHYKAVDMEAKLARMRETLAAIAADEPKLVIDEVDPSPEARARVARQWFGRDDMPLKAWNGSPIYAYLFGMSATGADQVVHFDGDMLFGGGSTDWVAEALDVLHEEDDCAFVSPLSGPPHPDGELIGQGEHWKDTRFGPIEGRERAYRFNTVSTRIFLTSITLLKERLGGPVPMRAPGLKEWLFAALLENPRETIELERMLAEAMAASGLCRIDMLGSAPGMWTLHPPYRSDEFYARLPELVHRVETGDLPEGQLGRYDLGAPLIDWSEVARQKSRANRWKQHAHHVAGRLNPLR